MVLSKKEYLKQLQKDAAGGNPLKTDVGRKKLLKSLAALGISASIFTGIGVAGTENAKETAYELGEQITFENLGYKDNFSRLNHGTIGNDINLLLSGGKILIKENVKYSGVQNAVAGFKNIANASYLNLCGNRIVYRDDKDRKVYAYEPATTKKEVLYDGNAGEVYCVGTTVYFIDYPDDKVCSLNLESPKDSLQYITDAGVKSFAVCGDTILYLNNKGKLKYLKDKVEYTLANNIESFYLNGDIIAKSGKNIIKFTTTGELPELIYQASFADLRLIGADSDYVYIQEDGILYALTVNDTKAITDSKHKYYRSIVHDNGGWYFTVLDDHKGKISEVLAVKKE